MAVRLSSTSKYLLPALALVLGACASSAPPLPPDARSVNATHRFGANSFAPQDLAMGCDAIAAEQRRIWLERDAANKVIESNRTQNQVAGYLGALFLVPLAATESNKQERDAVREGYERQDKLTALAAYKGCPS